jgi:hypothetical protein
LIDGDCNTAPRRTRAQGLPRFGRKEGNHARHRFDSCRARSRHAQCAGISCAVAIAIAFGMPTIFAGVPSLAGAGNQNTMMNPGAPKPEPEPVHRSSCKKGVQKRMDYLRKQIAQENKDIEYDKAHNVRFAIIDEGERNIEKLNRELALLQGQCG